jgi:glycosyltransferase involved in cell wall biosynthesis
MDELGKQEFMKLYLYPSRSQNEFLELNRQALRELGYEVKPVNRAFITDLLRRKKDATVVLHWVEDRVYGRTYRTVFQYFFKIIALIIFSGLFAEKVVWVRHNFQPHNGSKHNYRYRFLCWLYKLMSVKAIPLEGYYSSPSLLHPLYKKDSELQAQIEQPESLEPQKSNLVVFFGAVKKYKNLHQILDTWPKHIPLKIAGRCTDTEYQSFLLNKITQLGLNVVWDNVFLSDEELNDVLKNTKFVLLPHADNTMISSGSFYHAIGEGCNVLTNSSRFGLAKSKQHGFVSIYDPKVISEAYLNSIYQDRTKVMHDALSSYGQRQVLSAWRNVLAVSER